MGNRRLCQDRWYKSRLEIMTLIRNEAEKRRHNGQGQVITDSMRLALLAYMCLPRAQTNHAGERRNHPERPRAFPAAIALSLPLSVSLSCILYRGRCRVFAF